MTSPPSTFASLGNYNYRLFWFSQLISQIGNWMQVTAQAWLVLQLTGSSVALGTVLALQYLPMLCVTLFAGVVVDRVSKQRLLMVAAALELVQAGVLAALTSGGHIQLWHIYVLAGCLGLVTAFENPGRQAFVMELVGRQNVVNAVGLNSAQVNGARLIGPAIGGLVIAGWGVAACFFLNATSFLTVVVGLALMRRENFLALPSKQAGGKMLAQLREGLRFIGGTREAMTTMIMLAGIGCLGINFFTVVPLFAEKALHLPADQFGLLMTAIGLGSLLAALMVARAGKPAPRNVVLAALAFGIVDVSIGFAPSLAVAFGLFALLGCCGLTFTSLANTSLQLLTPDELRGRVMAVFGLLLTGTTPVGALVTGLLAEAIGIRTTVSLEGAVCLASVGLAMAYQAKTRARRSETELALAGIRS
jgi:MFS family permease